MSRDRAARHRSRALPLLVVFALLALVAIRGPLWYRRAQHPLKYEGAIAAASRRNAVDPYLIAAVINSESGFDRNGVSSKGAVGLMQLMPETAKEASRTSPLRPSVDPESLRDPDVNIELGTHHLGKLLRRYERTEWALAAYNAGATNVDRWQSSNSTAAPLEGIAFPVTKRYVRTVLRERDEYERLYPGVFEEASE